MNTRIITQANILTFFRILLVPLYIWLFSLKTWNSIFLALGVFILAAATDWYDGRLARSRKEITKLGKFLDPLADKFLVIGALVQFCIEGLVNVWLVGIIVVRDAWVTIFRVYSILNGRELATSQAAKLKTTIQLTVIITTIVVTGLRLVVIRFFPNINSQWVAIGGYRMFFNGLLIVTVVFTIYSWVRYMFKGAAAKA